MLAQCRCGNLRIRLVVRELQRVVGQGDGVSRGLLDLCIMLCEKRRGAGQLFDIAALRTEIISVYSQNDSFFVYSQIVRFLKRI